MAPWRRVAPLERSDGTRPIRHELARIGEAGNVAEFGDHRRRGDQRHPAQRLQCAHHRGQRPIRQRRLDMSFHTVASRRRRLDRGNAVFHHDVIRGLLESQSGHPATGHQCPRRPIVMTAMTQEKARELLTGLAQTADRRKTRAYEIADRLMSRIRNPDRGQFTGAMQLGEIDRIPPVGLDPIPRLAWINDGATTTQPRPARVNWR
jgi:hypothetical protein